MELKLDLKIVLFAIIFYFTGQVDIYFLCLIFALMHEIGHTIVAILLGYKLKSFKVMPLGFSVYLKPKIEDYNKKILKGNLYVLKNLIIAFIGPLTNILIFIIAFFIPINIELKSKIIYINALIAIFNLIPIYPLDGSKILLNSLKFFTNNQLTYKYVNVVSNVIIILFSIFSSIFILYAKNIAIILILIYLWIININENKKQEIRNKLLNNFNLS